MDCDFSPSSPHLLPNGLFSPQNRISFELLALSGLSGFSTFKGGKMLIFQGFANSRIVREFPPFSFKVRIATLTRNPSCDSFARGFKSHPLRQKPGSPQAFRAFFLQRKASLKSTKCTFLTHTVFYERGFEKHFQPLYNSNRYNRRWKHSDKKRKNTQALTQLDLLLGNT